VFPVYEAVSAGVCSCTEGVGCISVGKHPYTQQGFKVATTDEAIIRDWWAKWPKANIGIATGKESGLVVIDVDPRNGGNESLRQLEEIHGELSSGLIVQTGGGGQHIYFTYPDKGIDLKIDNKLGVGIDIKADGGYVVAPPSLHASGKEYRRATSDSHTVVPSPMPEWLTDMILKPKPETVSLISIIGQIPKGARNTRLTSLAGTMRRRGLGTDELLPSLNAINESRGNPPLAEDEVESIARSVSRYPTVDEEPNRTDLGNAERLVHSHGKDLRYSHQWRKWLIWDGRRWVVDERGEIYRRAKETVRSIYDEAGVHSISAANQIDPESRKQQGKTAEDALSWAKSSESNSKIEAMVKLTTTETGIPVLTDELDTDPWLLNCLSGSVDLRTGQLSPHSRENLVTKLAPVEYDPDAEAPRFEEFLSQIMGGDEELVGFLQMAFGYALTGDVSEQVIFIFHGSGANGKSTLLNTLLGMTGDYSMKATSRLLMAKGSDGHPTERADLFSKRLIAAHESEQGHRLNESFVKEATGGDSIRARRMREDFWQFEPTHKIFLATNHKPEIRGTDNAIWRRVRLIPFNVTIPDAQQDRRLPLKLKTEWPGILRWAVKGCLKWQQQEGLGLPKAVELANQEYRSEMDILAPFIEDCCELGTGYEVKSKALYEAYKKWCETNGEKDLSQKKLTSRLLERGDITSIRNRKERGLRGIGLVCDATDF